MTEAQATEWEDRVVKPLQEFVAGFDFGAESPDWRGMWKILRETWDIIRYFNIRFAPSGEAERIMGGLKHQLDLVWACAQELRDEGLNMEPKLVSLVRYCMFMSRGWQSAY